MLFLITLFVIIAILAILTEILFPVFAQAKEAAKKTSDLSNVKQFGIIYEVDDAIDAIFDFVDDAIDEVDGRLMPRKGKVEKRFGMGRDRSARSRSHDRAKTAKRRSWMKTA